MGEPERSQREAEFWSHHVRPFDECVELYRQGPDPNTKLALDALEPLAGRRVLDFACGVGVTSAWMADRGAKVMAIDVAEGSVSRAREVVAAVGADVELCCGEIGDPRMSDTSFDRIFGSLALHHVDIPSTGPLLAARLRPGGRAAFVETMFTNPIFWASRRWLVGRFGIPQYGEDDERPLGPKAIRSLMDSFGSGELLLGEMQFLRLLNRQVFGYRNRWVNDWSGRIDDALARQRAFHGLSYYRVLTLGPAA
jgi:SAM-dependent methyltransferase